jgi:hypothetical protein
LRVRGGEWRQQRDGAGVRVDAAVGDLLELELQRAGVIEVRGLCD